MPHLRVRPIQKAVGGKTYIYTYYGSQPQPLPVGLYAGTELPDMLSEHINFFGVSFRGLGLNGDVGQLPCVRKFFFGALLLWGIRFLTKSCRKGEYRSFVIRQKKDAWLLIGAIFFRSCIHEYPLIQRAQ